MSSGGGGRGAVRLDVSVVVPTYRRPALLLRCLRALLAQQFDPAAFEIIVVDDAHDERTQALVERLAREARPLLRYLRPQRGRGPAVARNCGWRAAGGALIAFTDDDTVPDGGWLAAGAAALREHPDWSAARGCVQVPRERPEAAPTDHERMTMGLETAEFVTANAFVRRAALRAVDGFDERFARAWREDSDLQFRLQAGAGPVGRCDTAIVAHPVRAERWGVSLRQQRNIFFDALLYKKHPRLYRQRIRALPPWDYYLIVLLSAAAPLWLLCGGAPLGAALLAALAVALVLRFALRRLAGADHSPQHVLEMLATSALIPFLSVYWRLRGAVRFRVLFL
jgi:glycosyltransferase involved in cell wall biosynthesis